MIVYLTFIFLIFLCWYLDKSYPASIYYNLDKEHILCKRFFFIFAVFISCLFMGMRYDVGWDYMAYYETITLNLSTNIVGNGEILSIALIRLSQVLNFPWLYFVINAIIQQYCVCKVISKYSKNKWLSLMLYLYFPLFYINAFSVIRFATALSITFLSFEYIIKDKRLIFLSHIIVASMFHKTALFCLVFYFLKYIKFNLRNMIIISISGIISWKFLLILVERFMPRYLIYLSSTGNQEGIIWLMMFWCIAIIIILFKCRNDIEDEAFDCECKIFLINIYLYTLLFKYGTLGHRISLYGSIYSVLILPYIFDKIVRRERSFLIFVTCLGVVSLFLIYIYLGRVTYIPYKIYGVNSSG